LLRLSFATFVRERLILELLWLRLNVGSRRRFNQSAVDGRGEHGREMSLATVFVVELFFPGSSMSRLADVFVGAGVTGVEGVLIVVWIRLHSYFDIFDK